MTAAKSSYVSTGLG